MLPLPGLELRAPLFHVARAAFTLTFGPVCGSMSLPRFLWLTHLLMPSLFSTQ